MKKSFTSIKPLTQRILFKSALATGFVAGVLPEVGLAQQSTGKLPNIVVILTDDQGYSDVGFNPLHGPGVITPNIDRIARAGVVFRQAYVTGSMCLPSRAGLLTGRYPQRFGVHWAERATQPQRLIADYLHQAGYKSTALGKWHESVDIAGDGNPVERGFDEFYGFNAGGRNYMDLSNTAFDFAPLYRGKTRIKNETGYLTFRITDEAVDFIKRNKENPFFLYVPYNALHTPLQAHIEDIERNHQYTQDPARKILLAMMKYMDDGIGKILDTLQAEGLYDNTLIFFLTDNGGSVVASHAENNGLRGWKLEHFEGGVRVPFVVSWPAKIQGGRFFDAPVSSLDILPTCLSAAGLPVPASSELDGFNLLPALDGKSPTPLPERDLFWWWKSGPAAHAGGWAIRSGDWKLIQPPGKNPGPQMLFNLTDDPAETNDLAGKAPEVVRNLQKKFEKWSAAADADASAISDASARSDEPAPLSVNGGERGMISNGGFESDAVGTAKGPGYGGVSTSTFKNWRYIDNNADVEFKALVVDGGSEGSHAMRFDLTNTRRSRVAKYGLDRDSARCPVIYGKAYDIRFDASLLGGAGKIMLTVAEQHGQEFFGQTAYEFVPVTDFSEFKIEKWTPLNPATTGINLIFRPVTDGSVSVGLDRIRLMMLP